MKGFIYILSSPFPALFGSTFENFQKNHFLLHFGTFLKIKDFPRIFVSGNSIRQKWTQHHQFFLHTPFQYLILKLNTRAIHQQKQNCIYKKKNGSHITSKLADEKMCPAKWPIFGHFLVVFLNFFVFPLTFGPCIIHCQKALAMRIPMLPSPSLQDVLVSVQIFVTAVRMKCDLQLKACHKLLFKGSIMTFQNQNPDFVLYEGQKC